MSFLDIFKRKKWERLGNSVSAATMRDELKRYNPVNVDLWDRAYRAIPFEDFMELVENYRQEDPHYSQQIFDCDDYAICFSADLRRAWADVSRGNEALAFGRAYGISPYGGYHVWMWHRDDKGVVRWVEPQTNRLMDSVPQAFIDFEG